MLFKKWSVDDTCVLEQYSENIGIKKGEKSGLKYTGKVVLLRGKRSGMGEMIEIWNSQHIIVNIPTSITTIITLIAI